MTNSKASTSSLSDSRHSDRSTPSEIESEPWKLKQSICAQCHLTKWRYTCPACSIRTCSLDCSRQHKTQRECNGKRKRVDYIPLKQYSWGSLMQDYSYLEDVNRLLDQTRRDSQTNESKQLPIPNPQKNRELSLKRSMLIKSAKGEGVQLSLMPDGMARRKMNATKFNPKYKLLNWTLELIVPTIDQDNASTPLNTQSINQSSKTFNHIIHHIPSNTTISDLIKRILSFKKLKIPSDSRELLTKSVDLEHSNDSPKILLLLDSVEYSEQISNHKRVQPIHVLEQDWYLSKCLERTKILEFPKLMVCGATDYLERIKNDQMIVLDRLSESQRQTDSGWEPKRIRLATAAANLDHNLTDKNTTSTIDPTTSQQILSVTPIEKRETIVPFLKSLVPYASDGSQSD